MALIEGSVIPKPSFVPKGQPPTPAVAGAPPPAYDPNQFSSSQPYGGVDFSNTPGYNNAYPGVTPPPAATPPPQGPDYGSILQNSSIYGEASNDAADALRKAAAERDAALKALEYAFKGDPNYSTTAQYNRNLANVESEYKRNTGNLESQYKYNVGNTNYDAQRQLGLAMRALAARNALTSGEKPWAQEENQTALGRALHDLGFQYAENKHGLDFGHTNDVYGLNLGRFDASRQYAEAVANANRQYSDTADEVARQRRDAIRQAALAAMQNPLYQYDPSQLGAGTAPPPGWVY